MSREKADYPHRPAKKSRPKSSASGGGRRKTWVSLREKVENGRDVGVHLNFPWWKAPMYLKERLTRWSK